MPTQCISEQLRFEGFDGRRVEAAFDGGAVTSDAGALQRKGTFLFSANAIPQRKGTFLFSANAIPKCLASPGYSPADLCYHVINRSNALQNEE